MSRVRLVFRKFRLTKSKTKIFISNKKNLPLLKRQAYDGDDLINPIHHPIHPSIHPIIDTAVMKHTLFIQKLFSLHVLCGVALAFSLTSMVEYPMLNVGVPANNKKQDTSSRRQFIASSFLTTTTTPLLGITAFSNQSMAQATEAKTSTTEKSFQIKEIQKIYDEQASSYEELYSESFISKKLDFDTLRKNLLSQAKGDVLELGVGTGLNLPHYPENEKITSYTAVDISPNMLEQAKLRFEKNNSNIDSNSNEGYSGAVSKSLQKLYDQGKVKFQIADVAKLTSSTFSTSTASNLNNEEGKGSTIDKQFDTIIDTFGLCVFPEPLEVLSHARQILSPNGQLLLLEHQDSAIAKILSPTRNLSDVSKTCRYSDDVKKLVQSAGFHNSCVQYVDLAGGFLINVVAVNNKN